MKQNVSQMIFQKSVSPSLLFGLSKVIVDIYFWNAVDHVTGAEI